MRIAILLFALWAAIVHPATAQTHAIVFADEKTFAGWPANGGLWTWDGGKEAAVCFVTGEFTPRQGHNVVPPYTNVLARTTDGGKSWSIEKPSGFFQPGTPAITLPDEGLDFSSPDLAIRLVCEGYHAGGPDSGALIVSEDRGKSWRGPFALPRLMPEAIARHRDQVTCRTDYLVVSRNELLLMGSARRKDRGEPDRAFCVRLTDGGRAAERFTWIQPDADHDRTMMSATVRLGENRLVSAFRVRGTQGDVNWVDAYESRDDGRLWRHLAKIGDCGSHNGNPPAMIALRDGRLFCAYGDRSRRKLFARISADAGRNWGEELVLRDDYDGDTAGEVDFGYPRAFQSPDGNVNVVYYWADLEHEANYIAVTRFDPN